MDCLREDAHSLEPKKSSPDAFQTVPEVAPPYGQAPAGGTRWILGARECRVVVSSVGACWNQERDLSDHSPQSQGYLKERRDWPRGPRGTRIQTAALVFASFFSYFHPTFRSEVGGVLGKRMAETPLPLHNSRDEIVGTPLH